MSTINIQTLDKNTSTVSVPVFVQKELYAKQPNFDEKDAESHEDAEYNPIEDEPQAIAESEDDYTSSNHSTEEEEQEESESYDSQECADIFQTELQNAIEHVQKIAKQDQAKILSIATDAYIQSTGQEPSDEIISEALQMCRDMCRISESEEEVIEVDPDVFQSEFAEALEVVREVGKKHQEIFVNNLCNTFAEINGKEASTNDLSAIFSRIKQQFSEEAKEDFILENEVSDSESESESDDCEDSDSDSDYTPADIDDEMVETDQQIDIEEEDEVNEMDENYEPEQDTFDYSQDAEDDIAESSESGSDNEADTINID